jgi:methyl-accepting chemotaxis protein
MFGLFDKRTPPDDKGFNVSGAAASASPKAAPPAAFSPSPSVANRSDAKPPGWALQSARNLVGSNLQLRERLDDAMALVTGVAQGTGKLASATGAARDTAAAISEAIDGLRLTSLTISDQVHRSQRIAEGVNGHAARARDGVRSLGESVNEIGAIVGMIAGLARQTNLLALNAAIEAARAGEAGRGFSIVASEVKSLSFATQKATEEISSVIERVRGSAYRSIDDVGALGDAITELHSAFGTVAEALELQTGSASEIAASSIEAARIAQLVDDERTHVEDTSLRCFEVMEEAGRAARDAHDVMVGLESLFGSDKAEDGLRMSEPTGGHSPEYGRFQLYGHFALSDGVFAVTVSRAGRGDYEIRTKERLQAHVGRIGILRLDGVGLIPARVLAAEHGLAHIVLEQLDREALAALDRALA